MVWSVYHMIWRGPYRVRIYFDNIVRSIFGSLRWLRFVTVKIDWINLICNVWQTNDLKSKSTGLVYELISSNEIILDYHNTAVLVKVWHFWQFRQFYYGDPNTIITPNFSGPFWSASDRPWSLMNDHGPWSWWSTYKRQRCEHFHSWI